MINFCQHRIVTFSLKFIFRCHYIILKSYNQWGKGVLFFSWGGGASFVMGECPMGGMGFDREVFKKNHGMGVASLHDPTPSIRGNLGTLVREVNLF